MWTRQARLEMLVTGPWKSENSKPLFLFYSRILCQSPSSLLELGRVPEIFISVKLHCFFMIIIIMESRLWNTFSQGGCGLLSRTRWAVLGLAYAWVQTSLQPPFVVLWSWPVTHCSPIPWGLHAAFCSSLPLSIMTLSLPVLDLITLTIKGSSLIVSFFLSLWCQWMLYRCLLFS